MFILIITIPFALQALKLAAFALWPFGRTARQAARRRRAVIGGQRPLAHPRRLVAGARPPRHRRPALPDDLRDPPRPRQLQAVPRLSLAVLPRVRSVRVLSRSGGKFFLER